MDTNGVEDDESDSPIPNQTVQRYKVELIGMFSNDLVKL